MLLQTLRGSLYLSPSLCPVWFLSLSLSLSFVCLFVHTSISLCLMGDREKEVSMSLRMKVCMHVCRAHMYRSEGDEPKLASLSCFNNCSWPTRRILETSWRSFESPYTLSGPTLTVKPLNPKPQCLHPALP